MYEEHDDDEPEFNRPTRDEIDSLFVSVLAAWDARMAQIGDTIPVKWFYDQLGILHPQKANSFDRAEACRKSFMMLFHGQSGFRTYLLKHRLRYLKANYASGYEVLDPKEQTGFAQRQRRNDINKALRDESTILANTDMETLSSTQRKENSDAVAHNEALARMLHRKRPGFAK